MQFYIKKLAVVHTLHEFMIRELEEKRAKSDKFTDTNWAT